MGKVIQLFRKKKNYPDSKNSENEKDSRIVPITDEDKARDKMLMSEASEEDFWLCIPFGEPVLHKTPTDDFIE